jgi:hypothetical protein
MAITVINRRRPTASIEATHPRALVLDVTSRA